MKIKSLIFVAIQFICIAYFILLSKQFRIFGTLLIISGLIVGFFALFAMRKSKFSVLPEVSRNSALITSGIYKYIRHPMYLSVLLACLGLLTFNPSIFGITIYTILTTDLWLKLKFEEDQLKKTFSDYEKYMSKTKRLIPKIL